MERFFNREFTFDRIARMFVLTIIVLLILWGVRAIWDVLLPFLLAGIFAYVVMPLVRFFQYTLRLRSRGLSVILTLGVIGALIYLAIIYVVPSVKEEVEKTLQMISSYSGGQDLISMLLPRSVRDYFTSNRTWGNLSRNLSIDKVIENTKLILDQVGGIINSTLSVFSWGFVFLMGIVYFIFILLDFENLGRGIISLFPVSLRPMMRTVFSDLDRYMNSYFRGQALVALSVGVLLSIGFNIIGLPMATAMGIFIGLLNFIPYMQALGIVPLGLAGLLMAAQNGENVFVCLLLAYGVLLIVQIIQDMILVPRIMGHTMGMRPSLILLVLTIWGSLLGFFGMLIALPATMFLYSFYKRYILEDKEYIAEVEERARQKAERRKKKSTSRHQTKASNPSDGEDESL
ncbi:AI-2E family transporter [Porphyromonas catoniae]|uniref:PF01594 domain protein n=1 Tax=Porphyromonas catoniae ATCC 51270 TaxID=887901 RepID=Z4WUM9_9PORP|nr:AI-2E family transporter [Porphyromonas catoniae]EWC92988.1 PF01594 domain protein [Porphyromonas catoniae ATCC 51270]